MHHRFHLSCIVSELASDAGNFRPNMINAITVKKIETGPTPSYGMDIGQRGWRSWKHQHACKACDTARALGLQIRGMASSIVGLIDTGMYEEKRSYRLQICSDALCLYVSVLASAGDLDTYPGICIRRRDGFLSL